MNLLKYNNIGGYLELPCQVPYMPIQGNTIVGDELLLSENQTIIAQPVLTLVENSTKSHEATIVVPNESFNIKLEGMLNTIQFQREIPLSFEPKANRSLKTIIKLSNVNGFVE